MSSQDISMVNKIKLNSHHFLRYLSLFRYIRYGRPLKSRVVIFDCIGSDVIKKLILRDIDHTVLSVRNEVIYIFPALLILFLKNLAWVYLFYRKYRGAYLVYLLSCIEYIKPQVVITFIDNNSLFHAISEIYNKAEFYAIQNGVRNKYSIGKPICDNGHGAVHSRANFFCFGEYEIDLYKRNGFLLNRFYPVGSLIGDYYRNHARQLSRRYDLCLVSQWRRSESDIARNIIVTLDSYVHNFVEKKKLSLCIARASQDPGELDYFKKNYGNQAHIINFDKLAFSTYAAMDSSQVILTFCSSAAYESFGWGKKVLFCNFSGDPDYNFPIESICSITDADYNMFERKLDWLINVDSEEYWQLIKGVSRYIMNYDPHTPAYAFIRKKLAVVLRQAEINTDRSEVRRGDYGK